MADFNIPSSMRIVTKEEFYAVINPLNVHPRPMKEYSSWEMLDGGRRIVGRTYPGYMCRRQWALHHGERLRTGEDVMVFLLAATRMCGPR